MVNLIGFRTFKNAASALENINAVSEGILTKDLSAFLSTNLPSTGKKDKITLGVIDPKLGSAINESLDIKVVHIGVVPEIIRGIRFHLPSFVKGLNDASMKQSELGLGHSYSRGKVKFNVNRVDNMIIQSIALVDQLDKDINTFSMRIREWYSYHFPELAKVVPDNYQYALCANFIKNRTEMNPEMFERLEEITKDSAVAQAILDAGRMSMGMDISPIDLLNIEVFAKKVAGLAEYRTKLATYLRSKMNAVAPNLSTLIGEVVGARLISHAGSLTSLAKYPASTVQILGAEKALFRAIKSRGNTPKYGLIFHSTFIGRASSTNKGRISRYLANKCSIASRIDCFSEVQTNVFGEKLKGQVEERLKFYESGDLPRTNVDVMTDAVAENDLAVQKILKSEKKKRKQSGGNLNGSYIENGDGEVADETPKKKKKKSKAPKTEDAEEEVNGDETASAKKKRKHKELEEASMDVSMEAPAEGLESSKKKKKKNKSLNLTADASLLDDSQMENGEEEKKKKKKKRKSQAVEAEA
ncbi:UNVERIFIED_CONTAM: hypothetical protein GTU68_000605 [Idotea baltica]|nr:hypothetical protein [Idotea baltica]